MSHYWWLILVDMCTIIQYRTASKIDERIRLGFKITIWISVSDWLNWRERLFDWRRAWPSVHHFENHKDSHSIKDFFRLNPNEHENMDVDAIPKHHKFGFKDILCIDIGDILNRRKIWVTGCHWQPKWRLFWPARWNCHQHDLTLWKPV